MGYIFLKEKFEENDFIYAIEECVIKTLFTHDTYDGNGQQISCYDAGDYSVLNSESELPELCKEAVSEQFGIDSEDFSLNDLTIDYYGNKEIDKEAINNFIEDFEETNAVYTEVEGFNYWDGHNWKTIVTGCDWGETSYEIIDDEDLTTELNDAIDDCQFEKEKFGGTIYRGNGYFVISDNFQSAWESYKLISEEDAEGMEL